MAAAPRPIVRPKIAVVVSMLLVGAASTLGSAAPDAAVRGAEPTARVYLPLVGHFTRDQLPAPVSPPAGPSATPRAAGSATATATGPGLTPPPTPGPTATRRPGTEGGGEWANFTLSRDVTGLAYDAARDRMWAGTTSGLVAWDVKGRTYEKVTVADGLLNNGVTAVAVDGQGRVWVGHDQGVSLSEDGRRWRALRDEDAVVDVEVEAIVGDGDGGTWFGTTTGLIRRTAAGDFERVEAPEAVADGPITCAVRDGAGNLWFGTDGLGVAKRAPDDQWRAYTTADGLPDDGVYALAIDGTGRPWAGTGAGLAQLGAGGAWTVVDKWRAESGAADIGRVHALAVAASGDVWLAAEETVLRLPSGAREAVAGGVARAGAVHALAATPDGAVWFGFDRGLARRAVDGAWSDWPTADVVPAAQVNAIAVGAGGRTWFGTANGVAGWGPPDDWRQVVAAADGWGGDGMAVGADGHAWVVGGDGLIEVDPTGEQRLHHVDAALPFTTIDAVALDGGGQPWIGIGTGTTAGPNVAWRGSDGRWQSATLASALSGRRFPYIGSIAIDQEGGLWVGSLSGLLRRAPDGTTMGYTTRQGLSSDLVRCIEVDAAGRVWVGTLGDYNFDNFQWEDGGLQVYDHGAWTRYTKASGLLANGDVNAIAFDDQGGAWIALKDGLSHRDGVGRWTSQTKADGLPAGAVIDVAVAKDGGVWVVVEEADEGTGPKRTTVAHRPAGGGWQTVALDLGAPGASPVRAVRADPNGGVVFGGANHVLWQAANGTRRVAYAGVDLVDVRAAAVDGAGNAYFGGRRGLVRRSAAGTWRMWTATEGLPDGAIRAIQVDAAGRVWLGQTQPETEDGKTAPGGGVSRLAPDGTFAHWARADGVASDRVNDLALGAGGTVWVAGEPESGAGGGSVGGGLSRLDADGAWTTFTKADGLADNRALAVAAGEDGVVWVGGARALSRRAADGAWTTIGRANGLPAGEIASIELGQGGDLWIGTSAGVGRLHPDGAIDRYGLQDGLGDAEVRAIGVGDGVVWFGHAFHGVSRLTLR